jgi:predicted CoA-binding protein
MSTPVTVVLGASTNPARYAYIAISRLRAHGLPVVAIGRDHGMVGDVPIRTDLPVGTPVHTVTLYLNSRNQAQWEERILAWRPARIIFNPGAENEGLASRARAAGIEVLEACTLVMLSTGQY